MSDILDYHVLPEMPFLEQLADELDCTLRVIAFAGREKNRKYIRESQNYFRKRFGKALQHAESDVAIFHIIPAYDCLQDLLKGNPKPEEIRQTCQECLEEHLMGQEPSEEYLSVFEEFYATD
jgi:hypothetical protein